MSPFGFYLIFVLLLALLVLLKPNAARIVIGLFFLVMAIGINMITVLRDPQAYLDMGSHALLPLYRWIFAHVIAINPVLFVIPIALFQVMTAVLLLHKNEYVHYGIIGAAVFLILIAPLGVESLPNLLFAAALFGLNSKEFETSFWQVLCRKKMRQ